MPPKKKEQTAAIAVQETLTGFIDLLPGETVEQKAQEFNEAALAIKITSIDQVADFKVARERLTAAVSTRTGIEKKRKAKSAPFMDAQKAIKTEADRLTALFAVGEAHLNLQVREYERLEEAEKTRKATISKDRQKFLIDHHFPYNGECFRFETKNAEGVLTDEAEVTTKQVLSLSEDEWNGLMSQHVLPRYEKKETIMSLERALERAKAQAFFDNADKQTEFKMFTPLSDSDVDPSRFPLYSGSPIKNLYVDEPNGLVFHKPNTEVIEKMSAIFDETIIKGASFQLFKVIQLFTDRGFSQSDAKIFVKHLIDKIE